MRNCMSNGDANCPILCERNKQEQKSLNPTFLNNYQNMKFFIFK